MKKISALFLSFVAVLAIFTSCTPVAEAPEISVTPEKDTVWYTPAKAGAEVTFSVEITPDVNNSATLMTFNVYEGSITNDVFYSEDLGGSSSSKTITYKYTVPTTITADSTITLVFEGVDDGSRSKSIEAKIYLMVEEVTVTVLSFNDITCQGDGNTLAAPNTNMINAQTGVVYSADHTPAVDIDLAYLYHGAWSNFIASPDAAGLVTVYDLGGVTYSTTGKNTTHIQLITSITSLDQVTVEFLQGLTITDDHIAGSVANGIGTQISVGDFVAFETADGYKGVFEVKFVDTAKALTTIMECDMRVLSEASSGK